MSDIEDDSGQVLRFAPAAVDGPAAPAPYSMEGLEPETDPYFLPQFIDLHPRLVNELKLREPALPFLRELSPAIIPPPLGPRDLTNRQSARLTAAEHVKKEALNAEKRFKKLRAAHLALRHAAFAVAQVPDLNIDVPGLGEGLRFNPSVVEDREYTAAEVIGPKSTFGLAFVDWFGRRPRPIVDSRKRVVAMLGGQPRNPMYRHHVAQATKACQEAASQIRPTATELRDGVSPTVTGGLGLVYEGEPLDEVHVKIARSRSVVLDAVIFGTLFAQACIQRVAGFATCLFKIYSEKVYDIFDWSLHEYEAHYTGSTRPFHFSVFSAATFFLGNKARYRFLDDDLVWGWTALTALGTYNHLKGGHIILWDLNIVVRFPPGSTILIPRGLVRYSFVEIQPGETRYLLAQYTPQSVFNFANNGRRSDLKFAREATVAEHQEREEKRQAQSNGQQWLESLTNVEDLDDAYYEFPIPPNPFLDA